MQTITYGIDNGGPYDVYARTYCRRITVQENYDSATTPTQDLIQYIPPAAKGGIAIKVSKGTPAVFSRATHYGPGDVAGQIKTSAGSITVQHREDDAI